MWLTHKIHSKINKKSEHTHTQLTYKSQYNDFFCKFIFSFAAMNFFVHPFFSWIFHFPFGNFLKPRSLSLKLTTPSSVEIVWEDYQKLKMGHRMMAWKLKWAMDVSEWIVFFWWENVRCEMVSLNTCAMRLRRNANFQLFYLLFTRISTFQLNVRELT